MKRCWSVWKTGHKRNDWYFIFYINLEKGHTSGINRSIQIFEWLSHKRESILLLLSNILRTMVESYKKDEFGSE